MKYRIEEWTVELLLSIFEKDNLNLNPPYQRNDIWPLANKKRLIDSIKSGYPLPMFFLHQKSESKFDMVDGQQRTRTLVGYKKGFFPDLNNEKYEECNQDEFNKYKIGITVIYEEDNEKILQDFYYRVNKFGTKLNRPEILKAQYFDTHFQNLVEELSDSVEFLKLGLFTDSSLNRMNDMDFIGELLALTKYGITDKKNYVDKLYEDPNFNEQEATVLRINFLTVLYKILELNNIYYLNRTRYSQRNDFYTLWSFLLNHQEIQLPNLEYFYKLLVLIGPDISPTNDLCFAFQEYATNCVSQSNSKKAREERLRFFEDFLLNLDETPLDNKVGKNEIMADILAYYNLANSDLFNIYENIYVPELGKLKEAIDNRVNI